MVIQHHLAKLQHIGALVLNETLTPRPSVEQIRAGIQQPRSAIYLYMESIRKKSRWSGADQVTVASEALIHELGHYLGLMHGDYASRFHLQVWEHGRGQRRRTLRNLWPTL